MFILSVIALMNDKNIFIYNDNIRCLGHIKGTRIKFLAVDLHTCCLMRAHLDIFNL